LGLPCLRQFADGVALVTDVGKDQRFTVEVAVIPAQTERELEMSGGQGEQSACPA